MIEDTLDVWKNGDHADWIEDDEPLPREEQFKLIERWQNHEDTAALKKLVRTNIRFVLQEARKKAGHPEDVTDLVQRGVIGLLVAAEKFDVDRGNHFLTYARWYVKSEFTKYFERNKQIVRLSSRDGRKVCRSYKKAKEELMKEGRKPTAANIAEFLDVSQEHVEKARSSMRPVQLSAPVAGLDGASSYQDMLISDQPNQEELVGRMEVREACRDFAETVESERDRSIWFERTVAVDPKTLRELGEDWGVSKERIRQVEDKLKRRFKSYVQDNLDVPSVM